MPAFKGSEFQIRNEYFYFRYYVSIYETFIPSVTFKRYDDFSLLLI